MYKIIMIDDEELALKSIPNAIDWEAYGLELTAVFSDAAMAMEYIYTHRVDGIFTDIKMPKISGLEISKRIHSDFPDTAVFLISAYSEFDYAYEAIENGVSGYILKPVNYKKLVDACEKMKEILDKKHNGSAAGFKSNCSERLQNLVSDYINRKADNIDKISQCLKDEKYDTDTENYPCAKISVALIDLLEYLSETWTHGKENLYLALGQLMENRGVYVIPYLNYFDCMELLVLSKTGDYEEFRKNLNEFKNVYTANCFENLNLAVSVSIIKVFEALSDINEESSARRYDFQNIYDCIESGKEELAENTLKNIINTGGERGRRELAEFLTLEFNNRTGNELRCEDAAAEKLRDLVRRMTEYFEYHNNTAKSIHNAKEYIDNHYNEHLSLNDVAAKAYLSVSQFTRLFKKEYDVSFINYLNRVRIEKACELLVNTDYSTNVICGMVGYTSYSYFSKKFRQYNGCSLIEYRTSNKK